MFAGWRRLGVGVGLALATLVLSGCHVQGTFDVLSEDRVALDFVVTGRDAQCANAAYVLKLSSTALDGAPGEQACRIYGQTQATYFSPFGIDVSSAAEYLVLQTTLAPGAEDWPAPDLHIRFPGQVVTASRGVVVGNEVGINDLALLGEGAGLRVVALARPGPPAWIIAAAVGTGIGVLLTLAVLALVRFARRPRTIDPALIALEPAELPTDADAATADPGPNADGVVADLPPPGTAPAEADHSWFASPELAGPPEPPLSPDTAEIRAALQPAFADGVPPAPEPDEPPDHSVWAPPDDRP